jgi:hypothetical protein
MEKTIDACKKDGNAQQHGSKSPVLWLCKLPPCEYCGKQMDFGGMKLCKEPLGEKAGNRSANQENKK